MQQRPQDIIYQGSLHARFVKNTPPRTLSPPFANIKAAAQFHITLGSD